MGGTVYKHGDHNVICARSGFKMKRSECLKEWTGQIVRREDYEQRHPQDFLRSKADRQAVTDPRPEGEDTFLGDNDVSVEDL